MMITRHYLTIKGRRVHYRKAGSGPPLIMAHQSPRSSAEYEELMRKWGHDFTCIAPDTPGFGQSDPLSKLDPDIDDYADSLAEFVRALGIATTAAYGFHSGGIILVTMLKRHPELFSGLAVGGYAIWTPEEMAIFGESYLPPFLPTAYGEHLTWLWNRILEQSWFFPWFDVQPAARLSGPFDDPARVHAVVCEMLDSGDAYRLGYGAVLRAPRDIPAPEERTPPVLITAYDGDPLQDHIDRLGAMPAAWAARKVTTPTQHQDASLTFLKEHAGPSPAHFAQDADQGFIHIKAGDFDGLIHWRGQLGNPNLVLHAPGQEMADSAKTGTLLIDLPGHGLSDTWPTTPPTDRASWQAVTQAACYRLGATKVTEPIVPEGDPDQLFPDLTPDRYGHYLTKAWSIVRARHFFQPWYEVSAARAIVFDPDDIAPNRLAKDHRALLRARAAREMMIAYSDTDNGS
jgi:haloalkane dehalogenase